MAIRVSSNSAWRAETQAALHRGTLRAPNRTTLAEEGWYRRHARAGR